MVGVIEPDADELARAGHWHAQSDLRVDEGERGRVDGGQLLERGGREHVAANVGDDSAQVAALSGGVNESGTFGADGAVANEFHVESLENVLTDFALRGVGG